MYADFMKHPILIVLALFCFAAEASAGLKIYYVRHGESGANVAGPWKKVPKELWPPYVNNENAFTPLGEAQVKALPDKLAPYKFDFIAVSPKWRARQTILGYLQKNGLKAEIWPELEEFGVDKQVAFDLIKSDNIPPPRPDLFSGNDIKLADDEKQFFVLRDDGIKGFKLREEKKEQAEDCLNSLREAIERIKKLPQDGDPSVLLVGHGNSGRVLVQMLLKKDVKLTHPDNTGLWMVEEQPDGSFALRIYNDEPVK